MKYTKNLILLSVVLLTSGITNQMFSQDQTYIKEYLERFEKSKEYILLVAEMMPENKYDFRATPESMSFEEHLMHITWAMDWHSQSLMGGRDARDWNTDTELKVDNKNKDEMIATVKNTFDITKNFISKFDTKKLNEKLDYFGASRTKRQILMLLADHITNHRAQMLVYLRLNGIKPPRYVLYQ
ncbi:DinB family protein [Winogradskyella litorisediminis]|uniref:DinB family protein n=1 Tax=Winogradskyella litorisediminis TaxID=1156618 RepID=A0ABW3NC89_9FLAO